MNRKNSEKVLYRNTALKILTDFGAVYMPEQDVYRYSVMTKAGVLLVSVGDDFCVCTKFTDIESAKTLGLGDRLNPHSGKWNWMGGTDHNGDMYDLAQFQQALRRIV